MEINTYLVPGSTTRVAVYRCRSTRPAAPMHDGPAVEPVLQMCFPTPVRFSLPLLLVLVLPCTLAAQSFEGRVVSVEEGDVLRVQRDTSVVTVQLYGIDTPELGQPYGREARHYVADRVLQDTVAVTVKERGKEASLSGIVKTPDGTSLNADLLRRGLAWWHNRNAPDAAHLQALEQKAQNANRGVWTQYNPVAPWKWRTSHHNNS